MMRFQVKLGHFPGEKNYVVVDAETGNTTKRGRRVLYTGHARNLVQEQADRLNEEVAKVS